MDRPYTFMQAMVAGMFRLPWEDEVKVTDGTSCGFPAPTPIFGPKAAKARRSNFLGGRRLRLARLSLVLAL